MSLKPYPKHKDSGVEWLGAVPEHWEVKRLKFMAQLNPSKAEIAELPATEEVSFIPMEAIGENGSLDLSRTRPISEVGSGYSYFANGDVIFAKVTPCFENGKGALLSGLIGERGFGTTEVTVLRPIDGRDGAFLWWLTSSHFFRGPASAEMLGAGGLKRVPDQFVADFQIAIPPLEERRALCIFLDRETAKIDALITEQEKLIALLAEKRQATISHAVTKGLDPNAKMKDSGVEWLGEVPEHWEIKRLKYLGDALIGLTYDPNDIVGDEQGTLVLRSSNVQNGQISFDDNVYVSAKIPERLITRENDILICSRNGSRALIGKNALITGKAVGLTFGAFMTIFRSVLNTYLFWLFNSKLFSYQSSTFLTATINQLTTGNLNSFEMPIPPEAERLTIVDYLRRETATFDSLTAEATRVIDLLKERRTALISAVVTGKIDVRGAVEPEKAAA